MRTISVEERRARLGIRHRLAPGTLADSPVTVADDLVGLHSSDPSSVYVSALARMREPSIAAVETALYEERTLVRMHAMRRTMWVFPLELAGIARAACTVGIALKERKRLEKVLAHTGIEDGAAWFDEIERATLRFLAERGETAGAELSQAVPGLRTLLDYGPSRWGGQQPATSRLLFQLAAEGRIVRTRPRGSWTSSQYRWAPFHSWLPGGLATWETDAAQAELARRWLRAFGPATLVDLKWWTGWTMGETRRALAANSTVEVELDGLGAGVVLADDVDPVAAPESWVAFLPGLDPTAMGWKERDWYFGLHVQRLFDLNGNVGPTVWHEGRVVGGWAQREGGEVVYTLLEDVGAEAEAAIEAAAARLTDLLSPTRVTARFPTPVERELSR